MGLIFLPLALICYFLGIFLAAVGTVNRSALARRGSVLAFASGWVLHLAAVIRQGSVYGRFPLTNMTEYLLVLGWVVLSLYLLVWLRWKVLAAGLVLPPLAAFMALPTLLVSSELPGVPHSHRHAWFIFHTTVSTLGMAALCVAFAMSLIYLIQDRSLKSRRSPRTLIRLPSLEACDRIGHLAILIGFPLLTLGIITGLIWSFVVYERVWTGGPKETFPLLAWVVFAGILFARLAGGLGGRRSAYLTIAGFALGLLTVIGMAI